MKTLLFFLLIIFYGGTTVLAATYPSQYDIVYHRISLTVDPGTSGAISNGSVTTYFKTKAASVSQIGFDFDSHMSVGSVFYHGASISTYTFSSSVITITFPAAITPLGQLDSVTVNFSGTPVAPTTSIPSGYNYSSTYKAIFTLGEAFTGHTWWPCKDSLVDKIDSVDIIITTPSAYRAGSNGVVTEAVVGANRICTWKTRYPIATYLINFAAANFSNYQFSATALTHTVPIMNYLYAADNNSTYQSNLNVLQNIMPAYATLLNTDYPFYNEKYGTAESGSGWGALEVQSMTFIDRTSYGGSGSILAHELSHQWFGDKLTTTDWHQIWLHEGFAEFFQYVIYPELLQSASAAASSRSTLKGWVSGTSTVYVPNISNVDNIFIPSSSLAQPYEKGAMALSMIRAWLGATNFYTALHNYLNAPGLAYNFTTVDSLEKYMQPQTPNDMTNFFNEWVNNKGMATYTVNYQYVTKGVYIQLTQARTASPDPGYFDMPVPIEIKNGSGLDTTVVIIDRGGKLYKSSNAYTYGTNVMYYPLSATATVAPIFDPTSAVLATTSSIKLSTTLNGLIVLPIQEISLSATGDGANIKLAWQVTADEPLQSIAIEKSFNGSDFNSISSTDVIGSKQDNYSGGFNDAYYNSLVYYRVRVTREDGGSEYSAVKVFDGDPLDKLEISPNPAHSYITVKVPAYFNGNSFRIQIYNEAGQLVQQQVANGQESIFNISCGNFTPGVYQFNLINDKKQQLNGKFIKE